MAINIKSPAEGFADKGHDPMSKGSPGEYDGEPGYQKRTPGAGGPPEKTHDGIKPKGDLDIKTPSSPVKE